MGLDGVFCSAENALVSENGEDGAQPVESEVDPFVARGTTVSIESHHNDLTQSNRKVKRREREF